jgi:hypothetical protein
MESRMMTVAMYHQHGRSLRQLAPIFAKIALAEPLFDPARLGHPFWGNVLEIVACVAHELFCDGNTQSVYRFYDKLLSSRIIFARYLRNWQQSTPTANDCTRIRRALDVLGGGGA